MQNIYGNSGKGAKTACGISDDDSDPDDYENVADNSKVPPVPERSMKANKVTAKREDLQLKYMDKPATSVDRAGNTIHGPRTDLPSQSPSMEHSTMFFNLDPESPAVNEASEIRQVEQTSEKKHTCDCKRVVLIFCVVLLFLFWILQTGIMFIYYFNISNQLTELKKNASQILDSTKQERETWKEELRKINRTLVNEIRVLKSDVQYIKKNLEPLGLCMSCPDEWTRIDSSCYFFSASHQTWENSQKECKKMNSYLLILNNKSELDVLHPLIGNKRFWIGLRKDVRNKWHWVDGTIPMYTSWNKGEPNNSAEREHCTEMIEGGWNDLDCSKIIDYICRKSTTC